MSFYNGSTSIIPASKGKLAAQRLQFDRYSQFPPADTTKITNSTQSNLEVIVDESSCSSSSNSESEISETISVHLRLRPSECNENCYRVENNKIIAKLPDVKFKLAANPNKDISEKHYSFNSIMDESVDQRAVYEKCVRPIINDLFSEKGATFLSYGTSCSGKTFTILGDNNPGIVLRAIAQIFTEYSQYIDENPLVKIENDGIILLSDAEIEDEITNIRKIVHENRQMLKQKKLTAKDPKFEQIQMEHEFELKMFEEEPRIYIFVSFIEIYNEKVVDLLDFNRGTSRQLRIMSNDGNSYVKGMSSIYVRTMKEAFEVLQYGLQLRKFSATGINSLSSRSHSIFFITLISSKDYVSFEWVTYKFCDLAGAERSKNTGNVGERLKESGVINSSLMVLGRCLEIVHNNQKNKKQQEMVPVRDSKLTFLLQSSLQGKERFVMIVNLLPSMKFFEENLQVLNFAAIAKQIVVQKATVRKATSRYSRYSQLMKSAIDSPRRTANGSYVQNGSIRESLDSLEDSSLEFQYMNEFDLRAELRRKDKEAQLYREEVIRLQTEIQELERNVKDKILKQQLEAREKMKELYEQKLENKERYYQRKIENIQDFRDRKVDRLHNEIEDLRDENAELIDENEMLKEKLSKLEGVARRKSI